METLTAWAADDGYAIEPYGLDISDKLAALARARLLHWAERIFVGNALTWSPPRRFDYLRTELVCVPDERQDAYVRRLVNDYLTPGGRAIFCSYGSARRPTPRAERIGGRLRAWGWQVAGEAEASDPDLGVVLTRIAWLNGAGR